MPKKNKLTTPDWIREGFDSEADYNKAKGINKDKKKTKSFKIKECPKCKSKDVSVVLEGSGEGTGWLCKKCGWKGEDVNERELNEDEFMKYLDEKGEKVA